MFTLTETGRVVNGHWKFGKGVSRLADHLWMKRIPGGNVEHGQRVAARVDGEEILRPSERCNHYMKRLDFTSPETRTAPCPNKASGPAGDPAVPNGGPTFRPRRPLPPVEVRLDAEMVPSCGESSSARILTPLGLLLKV